MRTRRQWRWRKCGTDTFHVGNGVDIEFAFSIAGRAVFDYFLAVFISLPSNWLPLMTGMGRRLGKSYSPRPVRTFIKRTYLFIPSLRKSDIGRYPGLTTTCAGRLRLSRMLTPPMNSPPLIQACRQRRPLTPDQASTSISQASSLCLASCISSSISLAMTVASPSALSSRMFLFLFLPLLFLFFLLFKSRL